MPWSATDIPDQTGRTIVVTGASSGLGAATTIALATRGAHVILANRSTERSEQLIDRLGQRCPAASLEHLPLDLADLDGIEAAATRLADQHPRIDAIVANAGVMATPLVRTADGFELQLGVNHLGHVALVGHLLPQLLAADAARVVVVSSTAHRLGDIDLDDLNWETRPYQRWPAYGRSKLANLLYVDELQRRFDLVGADAVAVAAHPGYSDTDLQTTGPAMGTRFTAPLVRTAARVGGAIAAQPASQGALPQLYAATAAGVPGGSYWGPDGPGEARGFPAPAARSHAATDPELAAGLWDRSEHLTGVTTGLPGTPA